MKRYNKCLELEINRSNYIVLSSGISPANDINKDTKAKENPKYIPYETLAEMYGHLDYGEEASDNEYF